MSDMIFWSPGVTLEEIEHQVVMKAFLFYQKNKTQTANALGIAIRTLEHKLEKIEEMQKAASQSEIERGHKSQALLARMRGQQPYQEPAQIHAPAPEVLEPTETPPLGKQTTPRRTGKQRRAGK
jgi:hypothetical protein